MELGSEKINKIKEIIKADNLETIIDKLFCELNGCACLGCNDECQPNYSLEDYWLFAYAFVQGFITRKGLKK